MKEQSLKIKIQDDDEVQNTESKIQRLNRDPIKLHQEFYNKTLSEDEKKEYAKENFLHMLFSREETRAKVFELVRKEMSTDEWNERKPMDPEINQQLFRHAADCSNPKARMLWAKLIKGEYLHPGNVTPRVIRTINQLSSEEASVFEKYVTFMLDGIIFHKHTNDFKRDYNRIFEANLCKAFRMCAKIELPPSSIWIFKVNNKPFYIKNINKIDTLVFYGHPLHQVGTVVASLNDESLPDIEKIIDNSYCFKINNSTSISIKDIMEDPLYLADSRLGKQKITKEDIEFDEATSNMKETCLRESHLYWW